MKQSAAYFSLINLRRLVYDRRTRLDLSLRAAAAQVGVSHALLDRFERGENVRADAFVRLWAWCFDEDLTRLDPPTGLP